VLRLFRKSKPPVEGSDPQLHAHTTGQITGLSGQSRPSIQSSLLAVVVIASVVGLGLSLRPNSHASQLPLAPTSLDPASINTKWTNIFDRKQQPRGWIMGDGGASLALPDGRELFMWADTMIGTVSASGAVDPFWSFVHNSLTTTDSSGGNFTTYISGAAGSESAYIPNVPARPKNQRWPYSGVVSGNSVSLMANEWTPDPAGFNGLSYTGNVWVIKLDLPSLTINSTTQIISQDSAIEWGSFIYDDDPTYTYVFGHQNLANNARQTFVYRVAKGQLDAPRQYRVGQGSWTSDRSLAVPLIQKELQSVTFIDGEFRGLFIDALSSTIGQAHAATLDGTWSVLPAPVYTIPEATNPKLLEYMPRIHPNLSSNNGVVMSYSVDAWAFQDTLTYSANYRPEFITGPAYIAQTSPTPTITPTTTTTPTTSSAPSPSPPVKSADMNGDNHINIFDLSYLLSKWGTSDSKADINSSGLVDIFDLSALLARWTG
jgi:hypothetical protein